MRRNPFWAGSAATCLLVLGGCATGTVTDRDQFVGTTEPFASESIYFLLTDRFVDGDPSNNYPEQGGDARTFDRPIANAEGQAANIGYLGGDFQGVLDHVDYIREMGFSYVWITPIVDNPDQAFLGGVALGEGFPADQGKTGYHGYWGVNFFVEDEHLVSDGLDFESFATRLAQNDLGVVLDVVCNHGSPSFSMPYDQPKFGELYDATGALVADHENLEPTALDDSQPLHAFFNRVPDIGQLSDLNQDNPEVLDYFVRAYSQWIDRGADALRIDTIKHMPHDYWARFSSTMRTRYPGLFLFAESYSFEAEAIATHTWPENGGISVLDFPMQRAMSEVFGRQQLGFERLADALHLDDQLYQNPYELMSFYDNHDMARLDADADGFIDANHWLFTARGIPVVYYGSESAFRAGRAEHGGNRDYFGPERIDQAREGEIFKKLQRVSELRNRLPALQRGLQLNLLLESDRAAFLRVLEHDGIEQSVLVLLNKGDSAVEFDLSDWLGSGEWRNALGEGRLERGASSQTVAAHDLAVWVLDGRYSPPRYRQRLRELQASAVRDSR